MLCNPVTTLFQVLTSKESWAEKGAFTTQSFMYGYVSTSTRNYARPKVAKYVVIAWLIFLFCHVLSKNGVPQQTNILPRLISILSIIGWWP